jgi:hypothetical protein
MRKYDMSYLERAPDVPFARKAATACFAIALGILAAAMVVAVIVAIRTGDPAAGVPAAGLVFMGGMLVALVGLAISATERRPAPAEDATVER